MVRSWNISANSCLMSTCEDDAELVGELMRKSVAIASHGGHCIHRCAHERCDVSSHVIFDRILL